MRSQMKAHMTDDLVMLASPSEDGRVYVWSRLPVATRLFGSTSKIRHASPLSLNIHRCPSECVHKGALIACVPHYGVATIGRLLKIIGLFCRKSSLL